MSRRPARETIAFAVALAALATLGGVAAASVASAAPAASTAGGGGATDGVAPANVDASAPNGSVDYDGERLVVQPATGQSITGTTTLSEGTQVTVRVRSSDSANPFLRSSVATVDGDGTFDVTMNFDEVERGTEFEVSVHYNGTRLATAPGVVGGCDPSCDDGSGSARFAEQLYTATAGETVSIPVTLSDRETATVVFGSDATNVVIPVTVEDGNGDGRVVLQFETAVDAPNEHGMSAKADADEVTVPQDVERPESLAPGNYDLEIYESADYERTDYEGERPADVGAVVLNEPTDDPATTRATDDANGTTTVGTIYGTGTSAVGDSSNGVSLVTVGALGLGGLLAVIGVVALVGSFD
ncbi:hypothetical protein G9C85_16510 [Halorubellus sp. JP-L1]|uniref:BGTF surface domain-containing protein n=1 Tax=Halorubellus sp. JP-L1 TaxID=2715753 RepID=UPI00140B8FCA|nr:BGTF surface domain-containing protein [Halorubellus sp. JP-L1]NHN43221.1 hypothetical protein [Halorubellus sp. JP-L1]